MVDLESSSREELAEQALNDDEALKELVDRLGGSSRRERQKAGAVLSLVAEKKPEVLTEYANVFVEALKRPEAQTRWEALDVLTRLVPIDSRECDKALSGAEAALFDEESGPLHLSAMLFLCRLGSTTEARSQKTWPLIDEGIQCYHGDTEFLDMLLGVIEFSKGKLAPEVADELTSRMSFDAENGKGLLGRRAKEIVDNLAK